MMGFSGSVISLLVVFSAVGFVSANFAIVEPYPADAFPVEHTSTQITCIAYDAAGVKVPQIILFVRKDQFAVYRNVTANGNIYFTKRTKDNGRKLFVTFHIRNVTKADDSQLGPLGRYECHAYAVGDLVSVKRGFAINVLQRSEIPQVVASDVTILQHGDKVSLKCNVTDKGSQATKLKRISWFKDGELVKTVPNPNPAEPKDTLGPLVISNAGVKDGGNYTCLLEALLRNMLGYNVSDSTFVKIAPWFENAEEVESKEVTTGENMTLECSARGFPLNVEWKVMKGRNKTVTPCVDSSTDKRYKIVRKGMNDPYFLSVTNLNTSDSGSYYCCLPSNCSVNVEKHCQRFTLTVTDPHRDVPSGGTRTALSSRGVVFAVVTFFMLCYYF